MMLHISQVVLIMSVPMLCASALMQDYSGAEVVSLSISYVSITKVFAS